MSSTSTSVPAPGWQRNLTRFGSALAAVAALTLSIGLVVYEANSEEELVNVPAVPPGHGDPLLGDATAALAQVRSSVLQDVSAVGTETGVTVTASATEFAGEDAATLASQMMALTEHSCADNVEILTPDNLKLNAWQFCFRSVPAEELAEYIEVALETDATHVAITQHPGRRQPVQVSMTWMPTSHSTYDDALDAWEDLDSSKAIPEVALIIYGTGAMEEYSDIADITEQDGFEVSLSTTRSRVEERGIYQKYWEES